MAAKWIDTHWNLVYTVLKGPQLWMTIFMGFFEDNLREKLQKYLVYASFALIFVKCCGFVLAASDTITVKT